MASSHLILLLVSQWVTVRLLLFCMIIHHLFITSISFLLFTLFVVIHHLLLILHHLLMECKLASQNFLLALFLSGFMLAICFFDPFLHTHPFFEAFGVTFFLHLFLDLLSTIKLPQVCYLLCLVDLLLQKPIVHRLAFPLIFFPFLLGDV